MAPSRGPLIAFEHSNRLASRSSEGADLSLQIEPLGREAAMLKGVPVALWSAAASSVHPANVMAPHRWSLARGPAPFRLGVASQRLAHIQEHGVVPSFFRLPLPLGPRH